MALFPGGGGPQGYVGTGHLSALRGGVVGWGMCLLRLARRFPAVAAWIFALLFWSNEELRYGLFFSGLAWIPLQLGLTGMMQSLERRPSAGSGSSLR